MSNRGAVLQINSFSDTGEAVTVNGWDYKYESLEGARFLPGTACPFRESFCHGEEGQEQGDREVAEGDSTVRRKRLQQLLGGPEGAPGTQGRLHRWAAAEMHDSVSLGTASARGWGSRKPGRARATWDSDCQATHILHRSKCFSFHTSTLFWAKNKTLWKVYICIYIHTQQKLQQLG